MAIKVRGLKEFRISVNRKISKDLIDRATLVKCAEFLQDRIYKVTKSGKSMVLGLEAMPLKKLSKGYKKYREKLFEVLNPTPFAFKPTKSNLTLTGQMLEALFNKVNVVAKSVLIGVKDNTRTPTPRISSRNIKPPPVLTNAQVASKVAQNGRPFLGVDNIGKKRVANIVVQSVRSQIRRSFKTG